MTSSGTTIVVTGAGGFVGQHVVHLLLRQGYNVRALVRRGSPWPFEDYPNLMRCIGDMTDLSSLEKAMNGADGVIHLASRKADEVDSEEVNIGGAKHLIDAAKNAHVQWIVNVSTQSTKLTHRGTYGETKKTADEILMKSGIPTTTLRMSLIYGKERTGVFGTLVRIASLPISPIIGSGNAPFQPIHVDDAADAIVKAAEHTEIRGHMFDVGGDDTITFTELIKLLKKTYSYGGFIVHIPTWFVLLAAHALKFLPHPPVTVSNVLGSMESIPMDTAPFKAATGFRPRPLSEGLRSIGEAEPYEQAEAKAFLSYCMRPGNKCWVPSERTIALYNEAIRVHRLNDHAIDAMFLYSARKLLALDLLSVLKYPNGILRRKLIAAAAIIETNPESSSWLLPKKRSIAYVLLSSAHSALSLLTTIPTVCALLLSPSSLKRNAGM